jgi:hypothetical protein
MDISKMFEIVEENDIRLNVVVEDKKVFEVKTNDKNIEINILDAERVKSLIKELRKWKS